MLRCFRSLCLLLFVTSAAISVSADTVTYTFAQPQFTIGGTTPLLNRAPNSGLTTFQASFTSSLTPNGFQIENFQPNVLFSGQSLFDPFFPADLLTLRFNMPVDRVQFNYAVIAPGRLVLTSPVGGASQNSAVVGGAFQGGTFVFSSSIPFTTFQLAAFTTAGSPSLFGIDNLTLNAIPEPATMILLGTGLAGIGAVVRKRRRATSSTA